MAEASTTLTVSLRPPRWEGGLPMLIMCDQSGEPLPGQVACQVTTHADGTSTAVVTFTIDGDDVALSAA
ncbi:MAG: hypothetical protein CMN63_06890 [Sphingobium sp.]|nr:hypothetical protein [Sphingobium sp.]|tara:strand:- start:194 stop:400 length:207 start_codon:yes stop_codon:yes gene_type:complete